MRRSHRVAPAPGTYPGYDVIEIRPERYLRVLHVNPRERDPQFEEEMNAFMSSHWVDRELLSSRTGRRKLIKRGAIPAYNASYSNDNSHTTGSSNEHSSTVRSPQRRLAHTRTKSSGPRGRKVITSPAKSISSSREHFHENSRFCSSANTASDVRFHVNGDCLSGENSPGVARHQSTTAAPSHCGETPSAGPMGPGKAAVVEGDAVLFLIHGVGGSAAVWQPQIDHFSKLGYELVVPDLLGHGMSSAPRDAAAYRFHDLERDVLWVFDTYCKERNVVIGHSYGACFAAAIGRQRARRVTKLVLISGGSPTPLAPQPGVFRWPVCCLSCCRPLLEHGFNRNGFVEKSEPYIPRKKAFDVPSYVLKHTMNGQDWPEGDEEYHSWISAQTLIIHGRQDGLISVEEDQEMQAAIYGSQLVLVEDASHMVMIEKPQEVNRLIEDFLKKGLDMVGSRRRGQRSSRRTMSLASLRSVKTIPGDLVRKSLH